MAGHLVLFLLAGFQMYYWQANGGKNDLFSTILLISLFVGGIYFLGAWAILTIAVGMVFSASIST